MFRLPATTTSISGHCAPNALKPLDKRDQQTFKRLVEDNQHHAARQIEFLERSATARDLIFGSTRDEALQMCKAVVRGSTVYGEEGLQASRRRPVPASEHLVFALADQSRLDALDRQMLDAAHDLLEPLVIKVEQEYRALEGARPGHVGLGKYLGMFKAERLNLPRREGQSHHEAVAALIDKFRRLRQTISETRTAHQQIADVRGCLVAMPRSRRVDPQAQEAQLEAATEHAKRSNIRAAGQVLTALMLRQTAAGGPSRLSRA